MSFKRLYVSAVVMLSALKISAVEVSYGWQEFQMTAADTIVSDYTFYSAEEIDSIAKSNCSNGKPVKGYDFSDDPWAKG